MNSEKILEELRTIRILLTIDKKDDLESQLEGLDEIHDDLLSELPDSEWSDTSEIIESLSEKHGVTGRTIMNRRKDLVESGFVQHRHSDNGHEYKKSGLIKTLEMIG